MVDVTIKGSLTIELIPGLKDHSTAYLASVILINSPTWWIHVTLKQRDGKRSLLKIRLASEASSRKLLSHMALQLVHLVSNPHLSNTKASRVNALLVHLRKSRWRALG